MVIKLNLFNDIFFRLGFIFFKFKHQIFVPRTRVWCLILLYQDVMFFLSFLFIYYLIINPSIADCTGEDQTFIYNLWQITPIIGGIIGVIIFVKWYFGSSPPGDNSVNLIVNRISGDTNPNTFLPQVKNPLSANNNILEETVQQPVLQIVENVNNIMQMDVTNTEVFFKPHNGLTILHDLTDISNYFVGFSNSQLDKLRPDFTPTQLNYLAEILDTQYFDFYNMVSLSVYLIIMASILDLLLHTYVNEHDIFLLSKLLYENTKLLSQMQLKDSKHFYMVVKYFSRFSFINPNNIESNTLKKLYSEFYYLLKK